MRWSPGVLQAGEGSHPGCMRVHYAGGPGMALVDLAVDMERCALWLPLPLDHLL